MKMPLCFCVLCVLAVSTAARAVDVTVKASPGEGFLVNTVVTFTAVATGTNDQTIYRWTFDDGTQPVVITGNNTVTHTFTTDDLFTIEVTVNNGVDAPATDFLIVEAIRAPKPDDPQGFDTSDPKLKTVTNPDNGVTFTLDQSQGGFIQGTLSNANNPGGTGASTRDASTFSTDFGDGVDSRNGNILQHRYELAGVYVMTSTETTNGSEDGKVRKTLSFSEVEMNGKFSDPNVAELSLNERKLIFKKFKGKFKFGNGGPKSRAENAKQTNDTVNVSWGMTLPPGFDVNNQSIDLSIGNVNETIPLNKSGKGMIVQPSSFKSVKFKFPKPDKGLSYSSKPFKSSVTVQMSATDLSGAGFDTEGITNHQHKVGVAPPYKRSIQVATMFAGETYGGAADVDMVVSKDDAFGSVSGRTGP